MGSASDRARELVAAIDGALEPFVSAETPGLFFPGEAKRTTQADARFLRRVLRATAKPQRVFESELVRAFGALGERAARAWRGLKEGEGVTVELTIGDADLGQFRADALAPAFQRLYLTVGELTYGAVSERVGLPVAWRIEDRGARAVIAAGGRRLGLVDLEDGTRAALFEAIRQGRDQGLGADALARRIRQLVPAGRFAGMEAERPGSGAAYRARMIARTETTYARNVSSLEAGRESGFEEFLVFDARLGPTDEECEALDGVTVSAEEAERLLEEEHPNGTRSISPVPRS